MMNNKKFWFGKRILFFLLFLGGFLLLSLFVMKLWNGILSPVLHISVITYGQALGIFILSKLLFGGFRGGWHGRRNFRMQAMQQRFGNMSPEEKEKFKNEWRERCSRWKMKESATASKAE